MPNSPGTIDSNYRGEVGIIMYNNGDKNFQISLGDRIAQLVLNEVPTIIWNEVDELDETNRGATGFGDSGLK